LSIRRLQPDPWHSTVADFKVGDVIDGTVTKLVNFGAFVRVRDGLEGLIHISELSHQRVAHPGDVVHEGQALKLKIISLDSERHRLGLSLKQAEEAPARPAPEAGQTGQAVAPAAGPRPERRPRPERGYSMSDAVQEPEGGIDNTLAAAFAQVRDQLAAAEAGDEPELTGEAISVSEPEAVAEAAPAESAADVSNVDQVVAEAEAVAEAEPVAEAEAVAETEPEPVAEVEAEPVAEPGPVVVAEPEPEPEAAAEAPAAEEPEVVVDAAPDAEAEQPPTVEIESEKSKAAAAESDEPADKSEDPPA
jgi:small subunit ribosomal protein S1